MLISALHGFLGHPSDWEALFKGAPLSKSLRAYNLFKDFEIQDYWRWAEEFNRHTRDHHSAEQKRILLGYSLGGRLALHALIQSPGLWHAAVIVSAHPGISSLEKRHERLKVDEKWACRFEADPWEKLMADWDGQAVFLGDQFHFERKEENYSRNILAASLRQWSLARQEDLRPMISQMKIPILWVVGQADDKYTECTDQLRMLSPPHSCTKFMTVPRCGHRVPWSDSKKFLYLLNDFLASLC